MASQNLKLSYKEELNVNFNSKAYLQCYTDPYASILGYQVVFLKSWHSFYEEHGKEFDSSTATMLEFGGGPTLWDLISAAPCVSSISFTDFAISNRAEIELWKNKNSECHNWRPYIEHVVKALEGNDDPKAIDIREQEVRDKIDRIAPCDARADKPLGDIQEKFDIIHSNLCLESVAEDVEAFYRYFSNMCQYLKANGYLILGTALECSKYTCLPQSEEIMQSEEILHSLSLKSENIAEACKRAGLSVVTTQACLLTTINTTSDTMHYQLTIAKNKTV